MSKPAASKTEPLTYRVFRDRKAGADLAGLHAHVRRGAPARAVAIVASAYATSPRETARLLGTSAKTIERRVARGAKLDPPESDRLARLARVFDRMTRVLGGADHARAWVHAANPSLRGAAPLDRLDTDAGTQEVLDLLGRIEHGVFG